MRLSRIATATVALLALLALPAQISAHPAPSGETWTAVTAPHFLVFTNGSPKDGQKVALQFEQMRSVILNLLRSARADAGQPICILALKNESSLRRFLPEFYERKGSVHPAGLFVSGAERDFVALRLDVASDSEYEVLYHEYTHFLLRLNYGNVPVWLNEGLAEFYGHTQIGAKEAIVGVPSRAHVLLLRDSPLLPLESLFAAQHDSPLYNEQNKASMFYAESWAIVHYYMLGDRNAKGAPLANYLRSVFEEHMNQLEAAQKAFGDFGTLSKAIGSYSRRGSFPIVKMTMPATEEHSTYPTRPVSEAEALSLQGLFLALSRRPAEARPLLEKASTLDPRLAQPHEGLGILAFEATDFDTAREEFERAAKLDSNSPLALYFAARASLRRSGMTAAAREESLAQLRKAVALDPDFSPAHAQLASLLASDENKLQEALQHALRAVALSPGEPGYLLQAGSILLRLNRTAEAQECGRRARAQARNLSEAEAARNFLEFASGKDRNAPSAVVAAKPAEEDSDERPARFEGAAGIIEGLVTAAWCNQAALSLILQSGQSALRLVAPDYKEVELLSDKWEPPKGFTPCRDLINHRIRASYKNVSGDAQRAEVTAIEVLE